MNKLVILAGGLGTRMGSHTKVIPKPMLNIGNKPIIWHIMKYYSMFGINDFIICLGYKGEEIKKFFKNYYFNKSDLEFDLNNNSIKYLNQKKTNWKIKLIDTGLATNTGGRLKKIFKYLDKKNYFFMTYGDGLSNVNINQLIKTHKKSKKLVTLTAVNPTERFGLLNVNKNMITSFEEKKKNNKTWINGGFFIIDPVAIKEIKKNNASWESDMLPVLFKQKKVGYYKHRDFWQCMDSPFEKDYLNKLWYSKKAPWKIWK